MNVLLRLWHSIVPPRQHAPWRRVLLPPPLPPLLLWQSLGLFWVLGLLAARWPWAFLLCALLVLWADQRLWRAAALLCALGLWCLGLAVNTHLLPQRPHTPAWAQGSPALQGVVDSVQGLPDGRWRILLHQVHSVHNPQDTLPGLANWTWDKPPPQSEPLPGQRVRLTLPLRDTTGFRNVGLADSGEYWEGKAVFWRLWSQGTRAAPQWLPPDENLRPDLPLRARLKDKLTTTLGGPEKILTQGQAFLPALLFGDRFFVSSQTMQRMAQASLVHSLALSGQHLALAALAGGFLVWLVTRVCPMCYLRVPRPKLAVLCCLPPALLYLWLGSAPASLVRAFVMLAFLALMLWRQKARSLGDLLLAALFCITLAQPLAVFDTGLQLSVLCVASIALVMPALRRVFPTRMGERHVGGWRRPARAVLHIVGISLAIQVALLPLFLLYFHSLSPWFLLNALWLPVLGLWVLPLAALGLLLLAMDAHTLAQGLLYLATLPCDALLVGLDWLAQGSGSRGDWLQMPALLRPHWTALPGFAALLTALALLPGRWPKLRGKACPPAVTRLALAGVLLLLCGPFLRHWHNLTAPLTLEVLDVGQGQALRLFLPGGQNVLVDGGGGLSPRFDPGRDLVAPRLAHNAAPRLWSVISSHPDVDHTRGLMHILRNFAVGSFWHNGQDLHHGDALLLQDGARAAGSLPGGALHAGMVLPLPGLGPHAWQLEVLHPPAGYGRTDNNQSLVLRLTRDGHGLALLTGDAEIPALKTLLASGQNVQAEVLILPHHGSKRSLLPALYDAVKPRLVLASAGRGNRFGFPSEDIRHELQSRDIHLHSTDAAGALRVTWQGQNPALLHQLP